MQNLHVFSSEQSVTELWLNSIQLTQLWLKWRSAWLNSRLIFLVFTADSTMTRLIWVRVESNLIHDSWVGHNPGSHCQANVEVSFFGIILYGNIAYLGRNTWEQISENMKYSPDSPNESRQATSNPFLRRTEKFSAEPKYQKIWNILRILPMSRDKRQVTLFFGGLRNSAPNPNPRQCTNKTGDAASLPDGSGWQRDAAGWLVAWTTLRLIAAEIMHSTV